MMVSTGLHLYLCIPLAVLEIFSFHFRSKIVVVLKAALWLPSANQVGDNYCTKLGRRSLFYSWNEWLANFSTWFNDWFSSSRIFFTWTTILVSRLFLVNQFHCSNIYRYTVTLLNKTFSVVWVNGYHVSVHHNSFVVIRSFTLFRLIYLLWNTPYCGVLMSVNERSINRYIFLYTFFAASYSQLHFAYVYELIAFGLV
jgi:hypothetical protein